MQVQRQQQSGGRTVSSATLGFAILVVLAIGVTIASMPNMADNVPAPSRPAESVEAPAVPAGSVDMTGDFALRHPGLVASAADSVDMTGDYGLRHRRALSWLNGLATGLILPTDVTVRLQSQDPQLARLVLAFGLPR